MIENAFYVIYALRVQKPSQDGECNPGFLWVRLSSVTTAHKEMILAQGEGPRSRRGAAARARGSPGQDCALANQGAVGKDESALA